MKCSAVVLLGLCAVACANSNKPFSPSQNKQGLGPPPPHHHPHHHHHHSHGPHHHGPPHHQHGPHHHGHHNNNHGPHKQHGPPSRQQQALPRFYPGDHTPQSSSSSKAIIASPKPGNKYGSSHPHAQYASPAQQRAVEFIERSGRSEQQKLQQQQHQSAQLIASASNTPVLVLKKDHSRPVLSGAVVAAAAAGKHHHHHHEEAGGEKPIPTVVVPPPQPTKPVEQETQASAPKPQQLSAPMASSLEHEGSVSEEDHNNGNNESAERRMFFENMQAIQEQQAQSRADQQEQEQREPAQAPPTKSSRAAQQHGPPRDEDEDDERIERIVRSNSNNPYGGGQIPFEYPPPQSNYIAQGPTRVPVKYQAGVIGIKQERGKQQQRPYKQRIQQSQQGGIPGELPLSEELEEEEEDATPDRLTELLATSKFTCGGKKDGYYADDTLNCEVFHYCQDGGKHSWLCPNGFAFHQIHLICVPPSSDNICKQSSNFHFVNEYLYRPINEKEAEVTNASLKYADRYYPDGYNHGAGDILLPYDDDEDDARGQHQLRPQQQPAYVSQQQRPRPTPQHQPQQQQHVSSSPYAHNPYAQQPHQQHHPSPRPTSHGFLPSPSPSHQPHRIPLVSHHAPQSHPRVIPQSALQSHHFAQQRSGSSHSPTIVPQQQPVQKSSSSSSSSSSSPQSPSSNSKNHGNPNVFFSPETINIPLNQRRPIPNPHPSHHPQIFRPSPQVERVGSTGPPSSGSKGSSSRRKFTDEYDDDEYL